MLVSTYSKTHLYPKVKRTHVRIRTLTTEKTIEMYIEKLLDGLTRYRRRGKI